MCPRGELGADANNKGLQAQKVKEGRQGPENQKFQIFEYFEYVNSVLKYLKIKVTVIGFVNKGRKGHLHPFKCQRH